MNHTYRTEGVVLKSIDFGEADKIFTFYTKHYGKLKALAKGVRKTKSRKGSHLQAFSYLKLFFSRGKNLDLLTEVEGINSFSSWRKNLKKVAVAFYFCELIDKLTFEGQVNKEIFRLLLDSFAKIGKTRLRPLVREFEETLLKNLGFGIPVEWQDKQGSLKSWVEEISEREINSPKILK